MFKNPIIESLAQSISEKSRVLSGGIYNPHIYIENWSNPSPPFMPLKYWYNQINASSCPKDILSYVSSVISPNFPDRIFKYINEEELIKYHQEIFYEDSMVAGFHLGIPFVLPIGVQSIIENEVATKISDLNSALKNITKKLSAFTLNSCRSQALEKQRKLYESQLQELKKYDAISLYSYIKGLYIEFQETQLRRLEQYQKLKESYVSSRRGIQEYLEFLLKFTYYRFEFKREFKLDYNIEDKTLIINFRLPSKEEMPNCDLKVYSSSKPMEWKVLSNRKLNQIYEDIQYAMTLRTICEIFLYDTQDYISHVCFNGFTDDRNPVTGKRENKCILSILVSKEQIVELDLYYVNPKAWFKHCKGVSAVKLSDNIQIEPIISFEKDKRIIDSKSVDISSINNLAEMDWEDFEHLVRQVFEWEFSDKGGEVNVTQSSRDGGVDAIAFDPDPIRGGKIIIQAKRYTNTVPVSAVRDLYGTIINEGANKGILITTSDYGSDSYKFAQGKPITLLNGGHLLYLLNKHGKQARIDIEEAKKNLKR